MNKNNHSNKKTCRRQFLGQAAASIGVAFSAGLWGPARAVEFQSRYEYDVLVVGSGAAGMTAALRAAHRGLRTLVIEKASHFGGSTARSGGGIWIRNNSINQQAGVEDTPELAAEYLAAVTGGEVSPAKQQAFLTAGPGMIDFVRDTTPLEFRRMAGYSDYYPNFPGAITNGASIEPEMLDGKLLGPDLDQLAPAYIPTPPGVVVYGGDYKWLTLATVSKRGAAVAAQSIGRYLSALIKGIKPLTMGQALAAGLAVGLKQAGVPIWLNTPLIDLTKDGQRIDGALVQQNGEMVFIRARKAVILASGGFEHNPTMRESFQADPIGSDWTVGAKSNEGDGILAGERLGAALEFMDDAWWGPSIMLEPNQPYFCLSERSLPGSFMVNSLAQRFVNESAPYHDVVNAMYDQKSTTGNIETWMIADQRWRNRYLFKDVLPTLPFPRAWYDNGAVVKAWTLKGLARKTGLPYDALKESVVRFNQFADSGFDLDHQRGENSYDQYYADPKVKPNPSLGKVSRAPYYAFKIVPGDLGTKGGLKTDAQARVLSTTGSVIPGLYAAGNTSSPVMGRSYAGAGSTLGPAMAFGYIAAEHIADAD